MGKAFCIPAADKPGREFVNIPRLVLAGLSGGTGKTILSLGIARAWTRSGLRTAPFKKGPDYIDAAWLGLAAKVAATNLDPYLLDADKLRALFCDRAADADVAVIEGNRGLFDGKDLTGTCSTAELARQLNAPVILAMDCTKMTRTAAAVVAGCAVFEQGLNLAGVILNRTAGERHREVLRTTIEHYTGIPVLGMLPKLADNPIRERHMGLVSDQEYEGHAYADREAALDALADVVAAHVDLDRLHAIAAAAPELIRPDVDLWPQPIPELAARLAPANAAAPSDRPSEGAPAGNLAAPPESVAPPESAAAAHPDAPVIGYIRDAALWFYYRENFEALERAGARLVRLSLLDGAPWPEIHGLYLGGGFPETLAERLSDNIATRERVRALAESGLPVYAECGGFMYLGRSVIHEGREFPMAGVFPVTTKLCERPQGLGYTEARVVRENPFFEVGRTIRGHEFHYSRCVPDVVADPEGAALEFVLDMTRGSGMLHGRDGVVRANVYAAYNHIFALGEPGWAERFVAAALRRRSGGT